MQSGATQQTEFRSVQPWLFSRPFHLLIRAIIHFVIATHSLIQSFNAFIWTFKCSGFWFDLKATDLKIDMQSNLRHKSDHDRQTRKEKVNVVCVFGNERWITVSQCMQQSTLERKKKNFTFSRKFPFVKSREDQSEDGSDQERKCNFFHFISPQQHCCWLFYRILVSFDSNFSFRDFKSMACKLCNWVTDETSFWIVWNSMQVNGSVIWAV